MKLLGTLLLSTVLLFSGQSYAEQGFFGVSGYASGEFRSKPAPKMVDDLVFWVSADGPKTLNGGDVSLAIDRSGQNNHAEQTTANEQPTLVVDCVNSKPCWDFDGSNDNFDMATYGLDIFRNVSGYTIITVMRYDTGSSGTRIVMNATYNSQTHQRLSLNSTHKPAFQARAIDSDTLGTTASSTALTADQFYIVSARHDTSATEGRIWEDGTQRANNTSFGTNNTTQDNDREAFKIGANESGSWFDGRIAEILIYHHSLTNSELNTIHNYLGEKYNITVNQL